MLTLLFIDMLWFGLVAAIVCINYCLLSSVLICSIYQCCAGVLHIADTLFVCYRWPIPPTGYIYGLYLSFPDLPSLLILVMNRYSLGPSLFSSLSSQLI